MKKTSACFALSFLLVLGCAKTPLRVNGGKAASELMVPGASGGGNYTSGVTQGCPSLPQAVLTPESAPPYIVGSQITWKISAQGCYGSFSPADQPEITFQNSLTFKKTYDNAGTFSEKRSLLVRDAQGTVLGLFETASANIVISSPTNPAPNPFIAPPTCTITRTAPLLVPGAPISVVMNLGGNVSGATLNGNPATNGQAISVPQLSNGNYEAYGVVTGPGGSTLCPAMIFTPPACNLAAANVLFPYADLTLTHNVEDELASVTVDGVALTQSLEANPIPFRRPRVVAQALAQQANAIITTDFGDKGSCTLSYAIPAPQITNVVISYMADAYTSLSMNNTSISLFTGGWHPAADLQILAVREDGSEVIEYEKNQPFLNNFDNQTFSQNGDFARFLVGPARPTTVRTATFATLGGIPTEPSSPVAAGSNRNGISALSYVAGSHVSFVADDPAWYAAYYQVSLCKAGFTCKY